MPRRWRIWGVLLGSCVLVSGCALSSFIKRPGENGCDPAKMAAHYALEEGETVLTREEVQRAAVLGSGLGAALEADSEGGEGHPCLACTASRKRTRLARLLKAYASDEA